MKIKKKNMVLLPVFAMLSLGGCSSVKEELGVGRHSPDEFTVIKRAPLSLPPDYNLRPPTDGRAVQTDSAASQAKVILMGTPDTTPEAGAAEAALLQKIGTDKSKADIRTLIAQENGYIALQNRSIGDKLIFWNDEDTTPQLGEDADTSVVDAKAEAERIKQNKLADKPLNEGDVPVIEKKKSTIDKIFK